MGTIGLLYVGAVLVINGLALLGRVSDKGSAPLNVFVGAAQIFIPTYLIVTSGGDQAAITMAAPLYLFGFTYLWVGLNKITGARGEGVGWFCGYSGLALLAYAAYLGFQHGDWTSTILWASWSLLFGLFFQVLALGKGSVTYTGAVCLIQGFTTTTIPALAMFLGFWDGLVANPLVHLAIMVATFAAGGVVARALVAQQPVTDAAAPTLTPVPDAGPVALAVAS